MVYTGCGCKLATLDHHHQQQQQQYSTASADLHSDALKPVHSLWVVAQFR